MISSRDHKTTVFFEKNTLGRIFSLSLGVTVIAVLVFPTGFVRAATFTVDSIADTADFSAGDGVCDTDDGVGDGPCTLRAAIQEANALAGTDTINFSIAGAGPHTISPATVLPAVNGQTTIDGSSEPDSSCGDLWAGSAPTWNIILDATAVNIAIQVTAGSSTIKGLNIKNANGADGRGISVSNANGVTIQCNLIENNETGIFVSNVTDTLVGGASAGQGNVINGHTANATSSGVEISGASATSNTIAGNFIGTNVAGTAADANATGITINSNAASNTIGGTTSGARNLISGNTTHGISLSGSSTLTTVIGNYIGLNRAGTAALANGDDGVVVSTSSTANTIGGTVDGSRNVISGNANDGIVLNAGTNTVQGNYIGTNAAGSGAVANGEDGIQIEGTSIDNTIGGTTDAARNIISGNTAVGLQIDAGTGHVIQGNYVGLDAAGTGDLGNGDNGISVLAPNTIGGTVAGARNVVSGNVNVGVSLLVGGCIVQGNYIGTDATGLVAIANDFAGLAIVTSNNTVGGTTAAARNVFSGNLFGIVFADQGADPTGNTVQGNYIGVGSDGTTSVPNYAGIEMVGSGTANNMVGGTASGAANIIANSNGGANVGGITTYDGTGLAFGPPGSGNAFLGNSIYNNNGLGIELSSAQTPAAPGGVTANDAGDVDTGPNNFQNFPVLTSATTSATATSVTGTLSSNAGGTYRIEFFSNPTADGSGNGEGEVYLGATTVIVDLAGETSFTYNNLPATTVGHVITATASRDEGSGNYSTSEFSLAVTLTATPTSSTSSGGGSFSIGPITNPTTSSSTPSVPVVTPPAEEPTTPAETPVPPLGVTEEFCLGGLVAYFPNSRSLTEEVRGVVTFARLFKALPTSSSDWCSHHYLTYGGRIQNRNLDLERQGITRFAFILRRLPSSSLDWLMVHVLGYVK